MTQKFEDLTKVPENLYICTFMQINIHKFWVFLESLIELLGI